LVIPIPSQYYDGIIAKQISATLFDDLKTGVILRPAAKLTLNLEVRFVVGLKMGEILR